MPNSISIDITIIESVEKETDIYNIKTLGTNKS